MPDVLDGLDPDQRRACETLHGPVCIVAGAGTGKTRTITHRIAHAVLSGEVEPARILAVTHSQKAAGEMRTRLNALGVGSVSARTFHSAALAQLRFFWSHLGRDHDLVLLDTKPRYSLVRRALEQVLRRDAKSDEVFDANSEISWAKARLVSPSGYERAAREAARSTTLEATDLARAYTLYESLKESSGRIDFEDLLGLLAALIETDDEVATHVRATYTHFVVDEYQDVDPLQWRLLSAWLGPRDDICVVGDPRQSIYAFRGAEPALFSTFTKRFPHAPVVELTRDYRSTPQVVRAANTLIGSRQDSLVGQLPPGPPPSVRAFSTEADEEKYLVTAIKELMAAGTPMSEISVLYRFNAQSARLEAALAAAAIPYLVADSEKFFSRPEVKGVLAALWDAATRNPDAVGLELLGDVLANQGFDRNDPPAGAGAARSRFEAVSALLTMIETMPGIETLGVRHLLDEMRHRASESHQPVVNGVTLCTLHKAKGLEWEVVFMVNTTEGSLPSTYADTPDLVAEERRLAYVGATRAKRVLVLTYARTNAKGWSSKPSRFLTAFGATDAAQPRSGPARRSRPARTTRTPRRRHTHCTDCGTPLVPALAWVGLCASCVPSAVSELADRLLAWRRDTAARTGVRELDLLDDELLWRLVSTRPRKLSAVVGVEGFTDSGASAYGQEIAALCRQQP